MKDREVKRERKEQILKGAGTTSRLPSASVLVFLTGRARVRGVRPDKAGWTCSDIS